MKDINNVKIKGEDSSKYKNSHICLKGDVEGISKSTVTYWNLIRSYLMLHSKGKFLCFVASGMNYSNDFLHYAKCVEFADEESMNQFYIENQEEVAIRAIDGDVID
jgi:hypothetical protein